MKFARLAAKLTNHELSVRQSVRRDFKIERRGALADAATSVVVRAVAGAKPPTVLASSGDRHATQMSADAQHHQPGEKSIIKPLVYDELAMKKVLVLPFRVLDAVLIRLGILQDTHIHRLLAADLVSSSVSNEHRLSSPLDRHGRSLGDVADVELRRGQS